METIKPDKKKLLSISLVGDDLCGKTQMIRTYLGEPFSNSKIMTLIVDFSLQNIEISNGFIREDIRLKICDTPPSNMRTRNIVKKHLESSNGVMLVTNVTVDNYLETVDDLIKLINEVKDIHTFPIILVGNKIDLLEKRKISKEDCLTIAKKNNLPYFETSALLGTGIDEAFNSLIRLAYANLFQKPRYEYKIIKFPLSYKTQYNNRHYLEKSTKELKLLISKIDSLEEEEYFYSSITELDNFLEMMKPTKCDINYQKYFSLLVRKIKSISNLSKKAKYYVKMYYELIIVFREIETFLTSVFNKDTILAYIHILDDNTLKSNYYSLYTMNYTKLNCLNLEDLIKIYECNFIIHLRDLTDFFEFINESTNMIVVFSERIKVINNETKKFNKTYKYWYIIQIIESFGDIIIYIIVTLLLTDNFEIIKAILKIIKLITPIYFKIQETHNIIDKELLYKLVCLYCLLYCYSSKHPNYNLNNDYIIEIIQTYTKISVSFLFDIFYSMNQGNKENNDLLHKFTKQIYLPYYNLIASYEGQSTKETFLDKYDTTMNQVIFSNENLNVYLGCLMLLSDLYQSYNSTISNEVNKYPPFITIKELYLLSSLEQNVKHSIYYCNKEIISFLIIILTKNSKEFLISEWVIIIRLVNLMIENLLLRKNENNYYSICFNSYIEVLHIMYNNNKFDNFLRNSDVRKEIISIIDSSIKNNNFVTKEDSVFLFRICIKAVNLHFFDFIEPYVLLGFDENVQNNIGSLKVINELQILSTLTDIIKSEESEREYIILVIMNQIKYILVRFCKKEKQINNQLITFIVSLVLSSKEQYKVLLEILFSYIPNIQQKETNSVELLDKECQYFREIIKQLLIVTNNEETKHYIISLIELSLTKKILGPMPSFENNKKKEILEDESIIFYIFRELMIIKEQGDIYFTNSQNDTICYRKSFNKEINNSNESYYYIDYDSILSKFVWFYAKVFVYQLSNEYMTQYDSHWNSFELFYSDIPFIDQYINISLNSLYLLPKEHLVQFIQIFCFVFKNNILPNDITSYNSIINFLITCNYLINYQSIEFYINSLEDQTNEVYYTFDKELKLKETILTSIIDIVATTASDNIFKYFHLFSLFTFYFNSTLDQPIEDTSIFKKTNITIVYLTQIIISLLNNKSGIEEHFVILSILYLLRDLIQYSDSTQLINCIYISLIISRPTESKRINNSLLDFITLQRLVMNERNDISPEILPFYYHFCDIVSLYYISYLNQRKKDENAQKFLKAVHFVCSEKINNDRDKVFLSLLENMLGNKIKRSNVNEQELINKIDNFRVITGNNNKIFCTKDNIVVEFTPSSNFQFILSFSISLSPKEEKIIKQKESKVDNITNLYSKKKPSEDTSKEPEQYIEQYKYEDLIDSNSLLTELHKDDPLTIQEKRKKVCWLLSLPLLITYRVNIFYFSKEHTELSLENLLSEVDSDSISPLYYKFISQLGDIYINHKGEKELSYKDYFYNIIFELVNLKKTKEEKIDLIKSNYINLIWIDDPEIDISNIDSIFDSVSFTTKHVIITIVPKTENHCLIRTKPSMELGQYNWKVKNEYFKICITDYMCYNYFINVNAYSGIRYLLNCIIITNDWYYYYNKTLVKLYVKLGEKAESPKETTNCFYDRLQLIKQINEQS